MKAIATACALLAAGCISIVVDPVRQWEGHYYTAEEVKVAVESISLHKGESVWILSDSTLARVLKNNRKD